MSHTNCTDQIGPVGSGGSALLSDFPKTDTSAVDRGEGQPG